MTKRITIKDEEYFKILELKGKYGETGLYGLLVLLDRLAEYAKSTKEANTGKNNQNSQINQTQKNSPEPIIPKQPEQPEQPDEPILTTELPLCLCGHPECYHDVEGCLGDGGLCDCKQFKQTA